MMLALKSTWAYRLDSDVNSDVEFLRGKLELYGRKWGEKKKKQNKKPKMRPRQIPIKAQCLLRV